ncbi:Fumarate hydratase class II [Tritrichomonas foetus]|uniref:fumarate hydratase n=1 Tax=Tritrichomonas foetus TaxID=1144522 RepID=A0A1J4KI67_9EUKA|nr:Fumarate hydratase class II [Tritrichomonas foetus]|eukprot:OHT11065.1 Fumarate hydratase class II [Tritrichomonas foetus]
MTRLEYDTFGEIAVPSDHFWGAQTQRSLIHFDISDEKMPKEIIRAFVLVKRAAATVNSNLGVLDQEKARAIEFACDEILAGKYSSEFPCRIWQTGSGSQTNMNVNEVIANIASLKLGGGLGQNGRLVHPNDDCNKGQSTNDMFPTTVHIASVELITNELLPALKELRDTLNDKANKFMDVIKIGRTHLQDATPLTVGQEFSGWVRELDISLKYIEMTLPSLYELAAGGTAVGTGINSHPDFAVKFAEEISRLTKLPFISAPNKFAALAGHEPLVIVHGALKTLATSLNKIANDVRWMASGPRSGLGEITIPENEPGSSIMPGKVNPTQCEAMTMVCIRVFGNDVVVNMAGASGNFELNVYKPVLMDAFIQSVKILAGSMKSFNKYCAVGIEPRKERIEEFMERSLMLVTALSPHIGYDRAAKIAKYANQKYITLKQAAIELGEVTEEEFDKYVVPSQMIGTLPPHLENLNK